MVKHLNWNSFGFACFVLLNCPHNTLQNAMVMSVHQRFHSKTRVRIPPPTPLIILREGCKSQMILVLQLIKLVLCVAALMLMLVAWGADRDGDSAKECMLISMECVCLWLSTIVDTVLHYVSV